MRQVASSYSSKKGSNGDGSDDFVNSPLAPNMVTLIGLVINTIGYFLVPSRLTSEWREKYDHGSTLLAASHFSCTRRWMPWMVKMRDDLAMGHLGTTVRPWLRRTLYTYMCHSIVHDVAVRCNSNLDLCSYGITNTIFHGTIGRVTFRRIGT